MNHREPYTGSKELPADAPLVAPPAANTGAADGSNSQKFTVMVGTFPKGMTFEQRLRAAADAGLNSVELISQYLTWTPEEWNTNLALLASLKLTVDSAVPGRNALADHTRRTALRDDLQKALPGAKRLGCSQFIYTGYTRVPGQTPAEQRAAIVDTLKYAADLLEKDGFEIVLEPIDRIEYPQEAVPSVVEAFEIIRAVGSGKVKVLYDFYHEQREAGNLIEKLNGNIDLIGLVHIADVPGRKHPGSGEIDYSNIYRKLAELNYSRFIGFEFGYLGDPVAELKAARQQAMTAMASAAR